MTNEISTITTIKGGLEVLNPSVIKDKNLLEVSKDLYKLQQEGIAQGESTKVIFREIRRKQAVILHQIERSKLYEKDGYKNVSAYAKALGFQPATASQLIGAGKVYGLTNSDTIHALPPSMAYELRGVDAKDLEADADKLADMTQEELREYRDTHTTSKPTAKVVKRYFAIIDGQPAYYGEDNANLATETDWLDWLFHDIEHFSVKADADKNKRYIGILEGKARLLVLKLENTGRKNGKVKTFTIEQLKAMGIDPAKLVDLK